MDAARSPSRRVDSNGLSIPTSIIREDVERIGRALAPVLRPLSGTTLLVTGGSGFLCSYFLDVVAHLNDAVWQRPCRMVCVDNLRSGLRDRLAHLAARSDFVLVEHDIASPLRWEHDVQWIIHGASIASPTYYRRFPLETIAVNVDGTRQVLELARRMKVRSVLYLSSSEIYGNPGPEAIPTAESYLGSVSCTGPRACYDESKRLAETLCTVYHRQHNLPVKVVRPFNVYGPGQRLDDQRIIPDLMSSAVRRTPIILYSDGLATRSFCYIADAIRAMWNVLLADCEGEAFNVGNDLEEVTILAAARCLQGLVDPRLEIQFRVNRDADYLRDNPQRRCPDLTKLRSRFSWEPEIGLKQGLARTLAHYGEALGKAASA